MAKQKNILAGFEYRVFKGGYDICKSVGEAAFSKIDDELDGTTNSVTYSESEKKIFIRIPPEWTSSLRAGDNANAAKAEEEFFNDMSKTINYLPHDIYSALQAKAMKNADASKKAADNKAFLNAAMGGMKIDDSLVVENFFAGATDGGSNIKITGNSIAYWSEVLIQRSTERKNEYFLGYSISGSGKNNAAVCSRVAGTIHSHPENTYWPSTIDSEAAEPEYNVFDFILKNLTAIQVKMPNAKKYSNAYDRMFTSMKDLYGKANSRWPQGYTDMKESIEELIDMYGDLPKMKEHNIALKMQFKLTGKL